MESKIGNYEQEFLDNWYNKLKFFLFSMMGKIVQFCYETIAENKIIVSNCEQIIKSSMNKQSLP